ncbi:hypothetical protein B5K06_07175 [Rhizobium grahamii]|uniref:Transmembrane protein n=2 Tax=Rhizobium grahamii TaxID=1120045 RepID=S3IKD9_9HYPH|nr:hypothetical protein RGCCGE502_07364 [Rhizobium grahamii CCGE 502]RDJ13754.1 hypothetical protein B5K06_07175 [Rhizobium grahamii]
MIAAEPQIDLRRLPRTIFKERHVRVMIAVIVLMIASVLSIVVLTPSGAGQSPGAKLQASVRQTDQN